MAKHTSPSHSGAPRLRILVSFEPDSSTAQAIDWAAWWGRTAPMTIRGVVTAVRPWPAKAAKKLGGTYASWQQSQLKTATKAFGKAVKATGINPDYVDDTPVVFVDGPNRAQLITAAAREFGADIIVLGPDDSAPSGRFMGGSTADALLHSSPISLGLMPRDVKVSKKGITRLNCVITDTDRSSEDADLGVVAAAQLATDLGLPLRLVALTPAGLTGPTPAGMDLEEAISQRWQEHTFAFMDRLATKIGQSFPSVDVLILTGAGDGWAGAIESVKWKKGDLMVLGSSPVGTLERVFVGSLTGEIIAASSVPALVLPGGAGPLGQHDPHSTSKAT